MEMPRTGETSRDGQMMLLSSPTPQSDFFAELEASATGPRAKAKENAQAQYNKAPEKGKEVIAKRIAKMEGLADLDLFATAAVKSLDAQPAQSL